MDQRFNGGEWVPIGTYNLTPGSNPRIYLDNNQPVTRVCADAVAALQDLNGPRRVVADAVKFVPNTAEAALTVHADHLGSPQKMTDGTGAVVWDAAFTPFGEEAAISGAATNNQRFPGQYFDAETGLYYNWMRDYVPSIGRYLQSDPIGLDGGLNTYAYVGGKPLTRTDRKGLESPIGPFAGTDPDRATPQEQLTAAALTVLPLTIPVAGAGLRIASRLCPEWKGGELVFSRNFRLNPFGSRRSSNPLGRRPHYHRRGKPDASGKTPPGQGAGRHRPWHKGGEDRSFWDRF